MRFLSSLLTLSAFFSLVVGIPATLSERRVRIPSVINNCSGSARPYLPDQIAAAPEYAPHLPSHGDGWEEWLMTVEGTVNGNENPLLFARWSRGEPASPDSRLENGLFAFWTTFDNGTAWGFSLNGTLVYSDVRGVKTWAIGDNKLVFDGNTGDWSHSIVHLGLSFRSRIHIPSPGTPFTPVMDGEVGLLRGDLHSRIEIPRGHLEGDVTYPWGLRYPELKGEVTLKHLWSRKPMGDSVDSYIRGVVFLPEEPSIQTLQWYQTFKDGKEVDSAQYTKQRSSSEEPSVLFQITNSPSDLSIETDSSRNSVITFPGCSEQGGTPNITLSTTYLRPRFSFADQFGGVISFHSISVTTNQWFDGSWYPAVNAGIGFLEIYQSSSAIATLQITDPVTRPVTLNI